MTETYTSSGRWPVCVLLPLVALCASEAPPEVRAEEGREQSRCQHRVRSYGMFAEDMHQFIISTLTESH